MPKSVTDETILNRFSQPFDAYFSLLSCFMREHGYTFTRPQDISIFFRAELTQRPVMHTALQFYGICGVKPIMFHLYNPASGYCYFYGQKGEDQLFTKWGEIDDSILTEYRFARALWLADKKHTIRPVFYRCKGQEKWFA